MPLIFVKKHLADTGNFHMCLLGKSLTFLWLIPLARAPWAYIALYAWVLGNLLAKYLVLPLPLLAQNASRWYEIYLLAQAKRQKQKQLKIYWPQARTRCCSPAWIPPLVHPRKIFQLSLSGGALISAPATKFAALSGGLREKCSAKKRQQRSKASCTRKKI